MLAQFHIWRVEVKGQTQVFAFAVNDEDPMPQRQHCFDGLLEIPRLTAARRPDDELGGIALTAFEGIEGDEETITPMHAEMPAFEVKVFAPDKWKERSQGLR